MNTQHTGTMETLLPLLEDYNDPRIGQLFELYENADLDSTIEFDGKTYDYSTIQAFIEYHCS